MMSVNDDITINPSGDAAYWRCVARGQYQAASQMMGFTLDRVRLDAIAQKQVAAKYLAGRAGNCHPRPYSCVPIVVQMTPAARVHRFIRQACELAGITPEQAMSRDGGHELSRRRFHVMWQLRECGWTYVRIAEELGGYNHTSCVHGINWWKNNGHRWLSVQAVKSEQREREANEARALGLCTTADALYSRRRRQAARMAAQ